MFTRPKEREPAQIARAMIASFLLPSLPYTSGWMSQDHCHGGGCRLALVRAVRFDMAKTRARSPLPPAPPFAPPRPTLRTARLAAARCTGCDLWRHATQTVFGEGRAGAAVVVVGEQPGHAEDLARH